MDEPNMNARVDAMILALPQDQQELLTVCLPKWSLCVIIGAPVAPERAMEIIRRTDNFFVHDIVGNDREFNDRVHDMLGMPAAGGAMRLCEMMDSFIQMKKWRETWGALHTEYLYNAWVSYPSVRGWCSPDGTISFRNNFRKYPQADAVLRDLFAIAGAFPDVRFDATLWDGAKYDDGTRPMIGFRVAGGTVTVLSPNNPTLYVEFGASIDNCQTFDVLHDHDDLVTPEFTEDGEYILSREHAISEDTILLWRDKAIELGLVAPKEAAA